MPHLPVAEEALLQPFREAPGANRFPCDKGNEANTFSFLFCTAMSVLKMAERNGFKTSVKKVAGERARYIARRT